MNHKKIKDLYKSILAVLLTITMVGCTKTEEQKPEPNTDVKDQEVSEETNFINKNIPSKKMTYEEMLMLNDGDFVNAADLTGLPDDLALEESGLTYVYVYRNTSDGSQSAYGQPIEETFIELNQATEEDVEMKAQGYEFQGIQVLMIATFVKNDDNIWVKTVNYNGENIVVRPVCSKEKIEQFQADEKALHDLGK